jgi:hypothetical protein
MTAVMQGSTDLISPRTIQLHPLCKLDRFGSNPLGDLKYRVVYAPTRFYLVGKQWEDNNRAEYRLMPLYRAKGWILERWLSPMEYCGMGPERWEIENKDWRTGLYITGPYPHRGEYEMCWDFEGNEPTHGYAMRVVSMIEAGRLKSYNEHLQANRDQMAKEEKARDSQTFDMIQNEMPTFRGQVLSAPSTRGRSGIRQFKTRPDKLGAKDLKFGGKPVPQAPRKFVTA